MKMVVGGTDADETCCFTVISSTDGSLERTCGQSKATAQAEALSAAEGGDRGLWCCASC